MSTNTIQPGFTLPAAAGQAKPASGAFTATFGDLLSAFTGSQGQSSQESGGDPAGILAPVQGEAIAAAPVQFLTRHFQGQQPQLPSIVSASAVDAQTENLPQARTTDGKAEEPTAPDSDVLPIIAPVAGMVTPADPPAVQPQTQAFQVFTAAPAPTVPAAPASPTGTAGSDTGPVPATAGLSPQVAATTAATISLHGPASVSGSAPAASAPPVAGSFSPVTGAVRQPGTVPAVAVAPSQAPSQPKLAPASATTQTQPPIVPAVTTTPAGVSFQAREPVRQSATDQVPQVPVLTSQPAQNAPDLAGLASAAVDSGPQVAPQPASDRGDTIPSAVHLAGANEAAKPAAVASTAAPAPTPIPQQPMTAQLARPLFTLATESPGEHVMTLKVSPEDLGPVTVRAHISSEGVRLELFAAGDAGRDAVRTALPELRRELAQQGLTATLDLSGRDTPGQGQSMGQQHRGGQDQRGPYQASLRMVTEAEPAPGQTVRPLSTTAALDVVA